MFVTRGYKGHYIHVNAPDRGTEIIEVQIVHPDGGFDLIKRNTYAGAQRFITKHVEQQRQKAVFAAGGTLTNVGQEARS
ncbi:hypothetical protein [Burkholderia vietnamiensis]|uniref:hypothetical protein n=1 Tax=Burkholderia vietnamiensis TaxID=60552 RepID=UPI001CF3D52B|nr:hypothetical protein [Burkholderia vietnamiensis]